MLEINLEVHLVRRGGSVAPGAGFRAFVLGVDGSADSGGRRIIIDSFKGVGTGAFSIDPSNYYITTLTWRSEGAIETEIYDTSQESQNDAFETIQLVIDTGGCDEPGSEEDEGMLGPKRMEITLKRKSGVSTEEKKVLGVRCRPPGGAFANYTLQYREWYTSENLCRGINTLHSDQWWIKRIEEYSGNCTSSTTCHILADGEKPWRKVAAFHRDLSVPESLEIQKWDPALVQPFNRSGARSYEDEEWYGYGGYCGGGYKPPAAATLRRAGDEIGAKIHLEQLGRLKGCQGPRTGEGILANADAQGVKEVSAEAEKKSGARCGDQLAREIRDLLADGLCQTY